MMNESRNNKSHISWLHQDAGGQQIQNPNQIIMVLTIFRIASKFCIQIYLKNRVEYKLECLTKKMINI